MQKKAINFRSCFDVIGPIMIGPSSSHTAGALQIGLMARQLFGKTPTKIECTYYESFAQTHKGHGTDFAIIAGVLGFATDDLRVPQSIVIAKEQGINISFIEKAGDSPFQHANTADLILKDDTKQIRIVGVSIGGGAIEIRYVELENVAINLQGTLPILIEKIEQNSYSQVKTILEQRHISVRAFQEINVRDSVYLVFELENLLPPELKNNLLKQENTYVLA